MGVIFHDRNISFPQNLFYKCAITWGWRKKNGHGWNLEVVENLFVLRSFHFSKKSPSLHLIFFYENHINLHNLSKNLRQYSSMFGSRKKFSELWRILTPKSHISLSQEKKPGIEQYTCCLNESAFNWLQFLKIKGLFTYSYEWCYLSIPFHNTWAPSNTILSVSGW